MSQHLPWFSVKSSFAGEPEITVRQLLTHTSGLPREAAFPYWTTHDFPTREQVRQALDVLQRWEAANGDGSPTLSSAH